MKNLILQTFETFDFSEIGLDKIDLFCSDAQSGTIYIYKQGVIYYHSSHDDLNLNIFFDWKSYYNSTSDHSILSNIVGMCFNSFTESLCIAFSNGDVITIDNHKNTQCVGCVSSGLTAMEWSYDQEVIVLATCENTIIVMSASFDPVVEVNLHDNGFGEKQFVTVGWGKKETQFHGSEGKTAAHAKSTIGLATNLRRDDGKPRISWRGDGTLFAVSVLESNNERCVRVFSREGILQYTSEEVPGLEESLSWRPSGNLIASTQRLPNRHQVAFFEKNGLRHGEFTIPFSYNEVEVCQLAWNGDSTILAIWLEHRTTSKSFVQLWTTGNYHWYLKQSLEFGPDTPWPTDRPVGICWYGSRLDVLSASGHYLTFQWTWATQKSQGQTAEDGAYVAVIDGAKVLLTSFRSAVPPPPMCSWEASFGCSVNAVAFAPDSSNRLCAILSNGRLAFIDPEPQHISQLIAVKFSSNESELKFDLLHHWLWVSPNQLLCCSTDKTQTNILTLEFEADAKEVTIRNICAVNGSVISLVSKNNHVILQLSDGKLFQFSVETSKTNALYTLPEPCSYIELTADKAVLSLSKRNRLYFDKCEIANNVTSFVIRPPFILITTLQHRLFCMKLKDLKANVTVELNTTEIENSFSKININNSGQSDSANGSVNTGRRIERGTRLVTVVPMDTRVVLQMPRGNLETVQPRTLCLNVAAEYLDNKEYRKAFELFRKQRINLNLMCDHSFEEFLKNARLFVDEINDASWLSLFLSELREDDTTTTTYAEYYNNSIQPVSNVGKVGQVCRKVREAMLSVGDSKLLLQPILASHVREGDVGEALKLAAQDLKALKFLSCLVDVDQLFKTALGLYDLELTAFVAAHSQKDPKEYLPFLNKIRKLAPDYQRYVIDEHLKRYELALQHIVLCDEEEHLAESIALVKNHCLFSQALKLYPRSTEGYRQVALAYAVHLTSKKQHTEAAILFRRSGDETQALEAFILSGNWREALNTSYKLGHPQTRVQELCRERLVPYLVNARRHLEAAQVYKDVLKDVEESIAVLAVGRKWDDAIWTAQRADRLDMIETHIKPAMEEQLRQLTDLVSSSTRLFRSYKARLSIVRATRRFPPHDDLIDDNVQDDCDLFSDRSSVSTRSRVTSLGRSSSRSSKNKRKHERKLLSLKEGGAFEDLALIRALHELVTNMCAMQDEVVHLCQLLLRFDRDEDARNLQKSLAEILREMEKDKVEIWTPELTNNQPATHFGPEATTNSILASLQSDGQQQTVEPSLIEPHLRIAPVIGNLTSWQLEML